MPRKLYRIKYTISTIVSTNEKKPDPKDEGDQEAVLDVIREVIKTETGYDIKKTSKFTAKPVKCREDLVEIGWDRSCNPYNLDEPGNSPDLSCGDILDGKEYCVLKESIIKNLHMLGHITQEEYDILNNDD